MKKRIESPITLEILQASPEPRPQTNMEALDLLVQKRVAEILAARDEFIFEPFFRSRQVAHELRRLQTVPQRKRWSVFFERQGCLSCKRRDQPYASNGLCNACHGLVFNILKKIDSELMQERTGGEEEARRYLRPRFNGEPE